MRKRPLSVGCLVVVILICIVTSLSRKEPWSCPELEGQTVIVQGRVYQKEVKTQGGQDKTVVYLKQVSFAGDNPVEGQSVVQEEAAEGQLLVQEKAAERQLLVQEEAAEKQLLVQGKCAEKPADTKATENILCYLREGVPEPEIGSLVILKGTLKNFQQPTNPGQFNAPFYYQILRISFRLNQAEIQVKSDRFYKIAEGLYQLRRKAGSKVDALLPEQEASVMKTMLLGEKRNLRRRNQRPLSEKWHCTYSCYFGASHFHDWNGTLSAFTKSRIKNKIKCHTGFHDHCSVWNDDRICGFSNPGNRHVSAADAGTDSRKNL